MIDCLGSGGAQRQMVNLALGLIRRGHTIEFFLYYPHYDFYRPLLLDAGVLIHEWRKRFRFGVGTIFALRRQIQKGKYDIVLSFLDTPNSYSVLARMGMNSPRLIVSERNSYPNAGPSFFKKVLEKLYFLSDGIVTNSYSQAQRMKGLSPWMSEKLVVIYNGIDTSLFSPQPNIPKTKNTFLVVGSITPRKNPVGLANAMVAYRNKYGHPPKVAWAGKISPDQLSKKVYEETNEVLVKNNLENNWLWLGEQKNMHLVYPKYTALIHPSLREGLPNVVCEAMACGLPVLLSDVGEHTRLVNHGKNGRVFDPNLPSDIADTIYEFLNLDESQQRQIALSAYSYAKKEFDLDVFVSRYEEYFLSKIQKKNL